MNNYNKLLNNLETLKLLKMRDNIDSYIDLINNKKKDIIESLYELTNLEIELRNEKAMYGEIEILNEKRIQHSIQFAGFPYQKTFEEFDFSFQPCLNKAQILDFKNLRFIENKENILFVGSPGVGKTHLATAIGLENAKNNHTTYFINCNDLIETLKKAHSHNRLDEKLKTLAKYRLLIIDEVGYLPIDLEAANMLFQLINKRYEKNSTIITTNKPFSKWGELFGDNMIANAILDRLLHHSHVISITGKSYRTKDILADTSNSKE